MNFKDVIRSEKYVVLDTETTGLNDGEIVQIAIVRSSGDVLLDTLVRPVFPIPVDATRIHGITDDMVKDAQMWQEVVEQVKCIVTGENVVVYNAMYDRKMMHQSAEKAGIAKIDWKSFSTWWCAMNAYAEFYGDWNSYHSSYRWQSLTNACRQQCIAVSNAHTALGDALMTLALVKKCWNE